MNEFYQPYYDFDQEPIQQGWIPDQNIDTNQIYESPYDLQYENQINSDIQNQFQNYMQQRAMQEQQLQKHESQYYQIKKGDTLSQIAHANGITVEQLAKLNGIKDINRIKAGSILRFDNSVKNRYEGLVSRKPKRKNTRNINTIVIASPTTVTKRTKSVATTNKPQSTRYNTNISKNKSKDTGKRSTGNPNNNPNNNPTIVFKPENKSDFVNYLYNDEIRKRKMSLVYDQRKRQFDNYINRATK